MISTSLIKAAEVSLEALVSGHPSRRVFADIGLGYHGINSFVDDLHRQALSNPDEVENLLLYAFVVGVVAERLFSKLGEDDEDIKAAVLAHPGSGEANFLGIIEEFADLLYSRYDVDSEGLTTRQIVETLRDKCQEDDTPEGPLMAQSMQKFLDRFDTDDDESVDQDVDEALQNDGDQSGHDII